jgi:DNA-binding MarR family transcriptional regulator
LGAGDRQLEVDSVERGLTALLEACERAVEGIGSSVPSVQLRALLIIDRAGALNLNRLALGLGASASASSRLCDRMAAAGLLTRERAAGSRREIVLVLTESGRRLASWVREQRRAALDGDGGGGPRGPAARARGACRARGITPRNNWALDGQWVGCRRS